MTWAQDLPYFKTGTSAPDKWLEKAANEIARAGGEVLSEGYGKEGEKAAFMMRFRLDDQSFRIVWPVIESKYTGDLLAEKRQAATMLYHDVKAMCVKARVLGARVAFFAHMELRDGKVASELTGADIAQFPALMPAPSDVVEADFEEVGG